MTNQTELVQAIKNTTPDQVVLLDDARLAEVETALEVSAGFEFVDASNLEAASNATRTIAKLGSQIEKDRKATKEPFLRMGQAIDEAARDTASRLLSEKNRIAGLVGAHLEEERKAREAEERRQREALEEAARQAEAAAAMLREEEEAQRRAVEEAAREAAEAEKKAAEEEDAAKRQTLEAEAYRKTKEAAELKAKAAEDEEAAEELVEEAAVVVLPSVRAKVKASVTMRTFEEVVILDLGKVPAMMNGKPLLKLETANAKKLLSAGVKIPGLELVVTRKPVASGR